MKELKASKILDIRFSEVDSMNVVWHGSYMLYFEDAREEFGRKYLDMEFHYRRPITYGMRPRIDIIYRPTEAAKIIFDYEIHDPDTDELMASGRSVQVFMDKNYQLIWTNPHFYAEWKKRVSQ